MAGALMWAWDDEAEEWIKIAVDSLGRLEVVAQVDKLNDIGDVNAPTPADNEALTWDTATGKWIPEALAPAAHKDTHDPQDGSDPLDTAIAVKVGEANAIGTSHSLARADHVHEKHHAKYTDAAAKAAAVQAGAITDGVTKAPTHDAVYDVKVTADKSKILAIPFIIDGGGAAITTGIKGHLRIPFACTISRVTMMADRSGSIVIDIWKDTYANFPPDNADSITASDPPTITTAEKSENSTLTGWTTAITADDILAFNVDSITDIQRVTLSLKVTKT